MRIRGLVKGLMYGQLTCKPNLFKVHFGIETKKNNARRFLYNNSNFRKFVSAINIKYIILNHTQKYTYAFQRTKK